MLAPGTTFRGYGTPAKSEEAVQRGIGRPFGDVAPSTGASNTPLHRLEGTITPSGLHFERHHNGVPDIDVQAHRLAIHGLVARPLSFSVDDLLRYPMTSRQVFIECGGNSMQNTAKEPLQAPFHMINGQVSCAEWTGVPLALLLEEAGIDPRGKWILAEGADAVGMSRSIPLEKAMSDTIVALYQNGERVRPENGYPIRLVVPGWVGNLNVKWLRRIKVTEAPTGTRDETSRYTQLRPDGKAWQFQFVMDVKSLICRPARGLAMTGPGFNEISGLAWSGHGSVARVEVSTDGGKSWAEAALQGPVLPMCLTRFRIPWQWDGAPAMLMSRATDDKGRIQPTREAWLAQYAPGQAYSYNAITVSRVAAGARCSMPTHSLATTSLAAALALLLARHRHRRRTHPHAAARASRHGGGIAGLGHLDRAGWRRPAAGGGKVFAQQCQSCHNEQGTGRPADRLTGGIGSLATPTPVKTVASFWPSAPPLFDYIRRAMPMQAPQSLTADDTYALVAYILSIDRIVPDTAELDAAGVRAIRMPNRDGFLTCPANR